MRRITALALTLAAGPLAADQIDGDWCSPLGAYLRIDGERIVTPGGQETLGSYSRHMFEYVIPEGEDGAGAWVIIRQLSEEQATVTLDDGEPQPWHRCAAIS